MEKKVQGRNKNIDADFSYADFHRTFYQVLELVPQPNIT